MKKNLNKIAVDSRGACMVRGAGGGYLADGFSCRQLCIGRYSLRIIDTFHYSN